ncbi:MAG: hypothetical protein M3N41_11860 [Acidobacteriota bacterium]|nr:hypothetical protein [Acidobacteriota bacterium]
MWWLARISSARQAVRRLCARGVEFGECGDGKQASSPVSWLKNALKDLASIYEALHEREKTNLF